MSSSLIKQLGERRVPQFLGLYLGVSWGLIQFVDWLSKRYLLSAAFTDAALVGLLCLLPGVVLLAYRHGAPGRDPWGRIEKIGLPLNVALTLVALGFLLHGRDLGATAQRVTVTDEDGRQVERTVPKQAYRHSIAIFAPEDRTDDPDLSWLSQGLAFLLHTDLDQNPYLDTITAMFSPNSNSLVSRLRRAGFQTERGVPLALARDAARNSHSEYLLRGELNKADEGLDLRLRLYETESGEALQEFQAVGAEAMPLVDELSQAVVAFLDLPRGSESLAQDLPVAERTTSNLLALQELVAGQLALMERNDRDAALEAWDRALEHDPSMAIAHLWKTSILGQNGSVEDAKAAAREALRHGYRLSERQKFEAKGWVYFLERQIEKRTALYEMWTELYPTDTTAWVYLGNNYAWSGNRLDDAISAFRKVRELDRSADWALFREAALLRSQGRFDEAVSAYREYAALHPEEHGATLQIAEISMIQGEFDAAREELRKPVLLSSGLVNPSLTLAGLELRLGNVDAAQDQLRNARQIAVSDLQNELVERTSVIFHQYLGQQEAAFGALQSAIEAAAGHMSPLDAFFSLQLQYLDLYLQTGRRDLAAELLAKQQESLDAPFDQLIEWGWLRIHLWAGRQDLAAEAIGRLSSVFDELQREDLAFELSRARGELAALVGDDQAAMEHNALALEQYQRSAFQQVAGEWPRFTLLLELGRSQTAAGQEDQARNTLESLLEIFPAHPQAHLLLGQLHQRAQRADQARMHLEQARAMWEQAEPGYPPAAELRELEQWLAGL